MDIQKFKQKPIVGILRGIKKESIPQLVETVIEAGLETIEITMNTDGANELIRQMVICAKGRLTVGAGTVMNSEQMFDALRSGASFIVSPVLVPEVVEYCAKHKIPVFPGALTPQEIYQAWEAGATMVKVFPANFFGPKYFKAIKAPLNNIELLACGGVHCNNVMEVFECGASAVAFGASIFNLANLQDGKFDEIGVKVKKFIGASPFGEKSK